MAQKYTSKVGKRYARYINSPKWRAKRAVYFKKYGRVCRVEGCTTVSNLHVHHHTYERLGKELLTDLVGLCEKHHDEVHLKHKSTKGMSLTRATELVVNIELNGYRTRSQKKPP